MINYKLLEEGIDAVANNNPLMIDLGYPFGPTEITADIMRKSLDYNSMLDFRLRNPDSLLLDQGKTIRLFDEMMLDDAINSTMQIKKRMVLSVPGDFRPASDSPQDKVICDFVKQTLTSMPLRWIDALDNMFDAVIYGFKVAEKVWKIIDSKIILSNLKFRHSLLFDFEYDEFASLSTLHIGYYWGGQHTAITGDDIWKKFIIFVYPYLHDGIYYGTSELKSIFNLWLAKMNILKWRNAYIQKFGTPTLEIQYEAETVKPQERVEMEQMIENLSELNYYSNPSLRNKETGELVPKFKINPLDVTKGGSQNTLIHERAIDQLDKMIKRGLFFPDKLGFSESPGGTYNMSETQFDILLSVIMFYLGRIEDPINKEIIPQLVNYNFPNITKYPEWKFDKIDNKLTYQMLQTLITGGVIQASEPWIRKFVNIPDAPIPTDGTQKTGINIPLQNIAQGAKNTIPSSTTHQGYTLPQENTPHQLSPEAGRSENIGEESQPVNVGTTWAENPNDKASRMVSSGALSGSPGGQPEQGSSYSTSGGLSPSGPSGKVAPSSMWKTFKRQSIHDVYNFQSHQKDLDKNEADFVKEYTQVCSDMSEKFVKQIQKKKIIENHDLKAFNSIDLPKGEMKSLVSQYLAKMYLLGKANAIEQSRTRLKKARPQAFTKKYFTIDETDDGIDWLDRTWIDNYLKEYGELGTLTDEDKQYLKSLRDKAFFITGEEETRILKTFHILDDGLNSGLMARDIIAAIETELSDNIQQYALTIARTNGNDAYNTAGMNLYMSDNVRPGVEAFLFSAIIDSQTTEICEAQNGKVIYKDDPELANYTPPLHFNALTGDTKISCLNGDKPISEIKKGDWVRTHTGKFRKVYDTMKEHRDEEIYIIELDNGQRLKVTGDHPIMTNRGWQNASDVLVTDELSYIGHKRSIRYCKTCGKEISIRGKKKPGIYCDKKCSAIGLRTVIGKKCLKCGKPMVGYWKSPISKDRRFCSQRCYFSFKGRTRLEETVASALSKMNIKYDEQVQFGKWFVDFVLPEHKIVIEADGNYWHDIKERWSKRAKRDVLITGLGYRIFHIAQDSILSYKFEDDLKTIIGANA